MSPKRSSEDLQKMAAMRLEGSTLEEIGSTFGISLARVCQIFATDPQLSKIKANKVKKVSEEHISLMASMRKDGCSVNEIADRLGISAPTVYRYFQENPNLAEIAQNHLVARKQRRELTPLEIEVIHAFSHKDWMSESQLRQLINAFRLYSKNEQKISCSASFNLVRRLEERRVLEQKIDASSAGGRRVCLFYRLSPQGISFLEREAISQESIALYATLLRNISLITESSSEARNSAASPKPVNQNSESISLRSFSKGDRPQNQLKPVDQNGIAAITDLPLPQPVDSMEKRAFRYNPQEINRFEAWTEYGKQLVGQLILASMEKRFDDGEQDISIRKLASACGISHPTLSNYCRGNIDDPKKKRFVVLKAIAPYIYRLKTVDGDTLVLDNERTYVESWFELYQLGFSTPGNLSQSLNQRYADAFYKDTVANSILLPFFDGEWKLLQDVWTVSKDLSSDLENGFLYLLECLEKKEMPLLVVEEHILSTRDSLVWDIEDALLLKELDEKWQVDADVLLRKVATLEPVALLAVIDRVESLLDTPPAKPFGECCDSKFPDVAKVIERG